MGLPRDAPAFITTDDENALKARHMQLEEAPEWCDKVPPLEKTLVIPNEEGNVPHQKNDERADRLLLAENILSFRQPIYFI